MPQGEGIREKEESPDSGDQAPWRGDFVGSRDRIYIYMYIW